MVLTDRYFCPFQKAMKAAEGVWSLNWIRNSSVTILTKLQSNNNVICLRLSVKRLHSFVLRMSSINSQVFTWVYKQKCKLVSGSTWIATNSARFMLFGLFRRAKGPFWSLLVLFRSYLEAWEPLLDISRDPQMAFWAYPGVLGGPYRPTHGGSETILDLSKGSGTLWVNTWGTWNRFVPIQGAWRALHLYQGIGSHFGPIQWGSEPILDLSRRLGDPTFCILGL